MLSNNMRDNVFVIAEAGVNHNGDLELAKQLIDVAVEAQADAVKFQTFKPGELTGKFAFKVAYQKENAQEAESRFAMSKRLALPYRHFDILQQYCTDKGILFLSTPDGYESLDYLVDKLNLPIIKISSTEVTHLEFLKAVAQKERPIILSTGMSTLAEVKRAVDIIRSNGGSDLTVLHCTSEYPTPANEVNLRAMLTLREELQVAVGYSDHTVGKEVAVAAVALGARIIEKHFTIDKQLPGPDHKASLDLNELKEFIVSIRKTEQIMGDGVKRPTPSELKNIAGVRRGIVAARQLNKGATLTRQMLTFKRPNTGIQPGEIDQVVGKKLVRDLEEDEVIQWEYLQ